MNSDHDSTVKIRNTSDNAVGWVREDEWVRIKKAMTTDGGLCFFMLCLLPPEAPKPKGSWIRNLASPSNEFLGAQWMVID